MSTGPTSTGPADPGPAGTAPTSTAPTSTGPTSTGPTSTGPTSTGPTSTGPTSTGPASSGTTGPPPTTPVRVLLVDDQQLVRAGFELILSSREDIEVIGEAGDGAEAVELAATLRPDVVLMDVRMPGIDGIEAARRILATDPGVRVVMLTTFDLDELVHAALRAGASGFLLKDIRPADLADAVRVVHRGDALLAPSVTRRLLDRFAADQPADAPPPAALDGLTPREREVLELIARGASNAEIASRLVLSEATVKTHVTAILRKLPARDRVQAVVLAYDCGLVRPRTSDQGSRD